jgi:hypothetical protein
MTTLRLVYLSANTTGGWITFTAHLYLGLENIRVSGGLGDIKLYKVRPRPEPYMRSFGYGLNYQNATVEGLTKHWQPTLIVAINKNYRDIGAKLLAAGAWIVVHDPAEFKRLDLARYASRVITIRPAVCAQVPGSTYIPHPYSRHYPGGRNWPSTRPVHAVSISRIDFDKNTDIILDANRILPTRRKVVIRGFENRIYTRFKIVPKYPEWTQSVAHYPRELRTAAELCAQATYMVDMSLIKGDGGGTQYTTLEAMDAGAIPVLHKGWIRPGGEMQPGVNCLVAGDAWELARVLQEKRDTDIARLRAGGRQVLMAHASRNVAQEYLNKLERNGQ